MSHALEPAIRRIDSASHNCESLPLDLLRQPVIFGEQNLLIESAQLAEFRPVKQHEHSRRKRTMQVRQILKEVIPRIKQLVNPASTFAQDVGGQAMQLLRLRS